MNIFTFIKEIVTNTLDELLLGDQVRLISIELLEQSVSPIPIFMEKKKKVFTGEGVGLVPCPQVEINKFE